MNLALFARLSLGALLFLSAPLIAQNTSDTPDPASGQSPEAAASDAPAIEVPADAAAAGSIDDKAFSNKLGKQPADRLFELLRGWSALLERQQGTVDTAAAAEEGTPERDRLEVATADRDALLRQTKAILAELRGREGVEMTPAAAAIQARVQKLEESVAPKVVAATASDEEKAAAAQEVLQQISTVPTDPATAHEIDLDVLAAQLRPLTQEQVRADLDAWMSILQNKAIAIRSVEVSGLKATDATEEQRFNERGVSLRNEREKLIKRVRAVAASLKAKGGDVAKDEAYLDSIVVTPPITGFNAFLVSVRSNVVQWVTDPEGGLQLLLNILKFVGILIVFRFIGGFVGGLLQRTMKSMRKTSDLLRAFVVNSVRKVVGFIGLVVALSQLGINIGPFLAAIGAAGFVIGFALQGTLSNFASGVMIMLYRPYDVGDAVSAAGVTGTVDSMTLVSTTIKTFDNQSIIVPNSKIWGDVITNVTANPTRRVDMVFGVGYGDDLEKAQGVFEDILKNHPLVLKDPAPTVKLHQLGDSSVNFIVRPWSKTADYWTVYWDVHREVKRRIDAEGLSIPFPQRDIHVYQHLVGDGSGEKRSAGTSA
jgi:small conductance mechanosensitive channel